MIVARDYQEWAVSSLFQYFQEKTGNPLIAMPTGTGKSVVIAMAVQRMFGMYSRSRVLVLTHVKELIAQNYAKLKELWPNAPAGIYSAGLGKAESEYAITFGGIGSVGKKAHLFGFIDILFIDEAHLVNPTEMKMYNKFIMDLRKANPNVKIVGLTATPWRLGHGKITEDGLFTDISCDMTGVEPFNWLLDQGYLSPLVPKKTQYMLDVTGVHMRGGELVAGELQAAVDKDHITRAAIQEALELGADRKSWLVFCAGVEHAKHVADILNEYGIPAASVTSDSGAQRDQAIADFKSGKLRALTNNNVLTTGFDHPGIDMIVMLRPTASAVLWVQMLGRGTRPLYAPGFDLSTGEGRIMAMFHGGKQNCLVLDFANNTKKLGPINDPLPPRKKGEKGGEAPVKLCQSCNCWNHASLRACAYCGVPFPEVHIKIKANASTEALVKKSKDKIDTGPQVDTFKVDHLTYGMHNSKMGDIPMVKVTYFCGLRNFSEFICVQHEGYAQVKARQWWRKRTNDPMPATSIEALERITQLPPATHISVWVNQKYPTIMDYCFDGSAFGKETPGSTAVPEVMSAGGLIANLTKAPAPAPYVAPRTPAGKFVDDLMDDDIPF